MLEREEPYGTRAIWEAARGIVLAFYGVKGGFDDPFEFFPDFESPLIKQNDDQRQARIVANKLRARFAQISKTMNSPPTTITRKQI